MRQWTHCIKESERRNKLKRFCELWCWESFQNSSRFAPTFLFYETEMMWWSGNSRFINLSTKEKQLYLLNICDKQYLHFGAQLAWVVFIQKAVIGEQRQIFYTLNPGWNVKCAVAGQLFQSKTNTKTKKKNPSNLRQPLHTRHFLSISAAQKRSFSAGAPLRWVPRFSLVLI